MRHQLHIIAGTDDVRVVEAEIEEAPYLASGGISGKLINVGLEDLMSFNWRDNVKVTLNGRRYRFKEEVNKDGSFNLLRDGW